jgi:hypothetical protein
MEYLNPNLLYFSPGTVESFLQYMRRGLYPLMQHLMHEEGLRIITQEGGWEAWLGRKHEVKWI